MFEEALRYEVSKNALVGRLCSEYMLSHCTLENLDKEDFVVTRPTTRFYFMHGLLSYLECRRNELLQQARVDDVRRLDNVVNNAAKVYFGVRVS